YAALYADDQKRVHLWMVRRVQRAVEADAFNVAQKVIQTYALLGFRSIIDSEIDNESSEAQMQLEIESLATELETGTVFQLNGVTHRGLMMPTDFTDKWLGDILCHEAMCRLVVDVEDC